MKRLVAAALLAITAPGAALAQPAPTASAPSTRMQPLAWMVGTWTGNGWAMTRSGRETFTSRETVSLRLSGAAIFVEGQHYSSTEPTRIVHDAMAMIVWDERTQAYRFRSQLASGLGGDFALVPNAEGFTWSMDTPGGRIDYRVTHEGGTWTERGFRAGPDGRPIQFFEMTLRRQ